MMKLSKIAALAAILTLGLAGITTSASAADPDLRSVTIANFLWAKAGPAAAPDMKLSTECTVPAAYIPDVEETDGKDILAKVDRSKAGTEGTCPDETTFFMTKKAYNSLVNKEDGDNVKGAALGLRSATLLAKKAAAAKLAEDIKAAKEYFAAAKKDAGKRLVK